MTSKLSERELILEALQRWIAQRPGLEFGNYGDVSSYRSELRSITKDLHHARALLAQVKWRDSITAESLKAALRGSFSGRLSWVPVNEAAAKRTPAEYRLTYCTGQYWPTEYRRAVCAVLASALWSYWRDNMPKPDGKAMRHGFETDTYGGLSAGDWIRRTARRELGASIAKRWFN